MSEQIQTTVDRLAAFISQNYSDIETAPGSVIHELLIKLAATIQNEQYNLITSLSQGKTLQSVINSNTDSYSLIMDEVASNFNTSRSVGQKAAGKVKITVSKNIDYNFQQYSLKFLQPGLNLSYSLTQAVRVSSEPSAALQEIKLQSSNGSYFFILDIVADEAGPAYQLSSGAPLQLSSSSYIANFVKAEAYGNFTSGKAPETDKELINKIRSNLGNARLESASGIAKKFSSTFTGFQSLSVCGANDIEMRRSKQNILGISTFGKADVYVRSSIGMEFKTLLKPAKKIEPDVWEMSLNNDDIPGFYYVKSILPKVNNVILGGTLNISNVVYGSKRYLDQRNNDGVVDSDTLTDYSTRFTKYQTAKVYFTYNELSDVAINNYSNFEITAAYQPNVLEMQDILLSDEHRLACADYLVKAVAPCMVSLNIRLLKKRPTDSYDSLNLQQLKKDIYTYINTIPFGGELYASNLVDICHNYDIKRVDLPIKMTGLILCPDGSSVSLQNEDVLTIPSLPDQGVTPKTALYFIDYYRVEKGATQPVDNIGLSIF
jgi:hypothetical protein